MTRRRRLLRFALIAGVVGAALLTYVYFTSPSRRINEAACYRITPGMSYDEVEAILGPAGDFSNVVFTHDYSRRLRFRAVMAFVEQSTLQTWTSNSGMIFVSFEDGKVASASFEALTPDYRATMLRWLHLK